MVFKSSNYRNLIFCFGVCFLKISLGAGNLNLGSSSHSNSKVQMNLGSQKDNSQTSRNYLNAKSDETSEGSLLLSDKDFSHLTYDQKKKYFDHLISALFTLELEIRKIQGDQVDWVANNSCSITPSASVASLFEILFSQSAYAGLITQESAGSSLEVGTPESEVQPAEKSEFLKRITTAAEPRTKSSSVSSGTDLIVLPRNRLSASTSGPQNCTDFCLVGGRTTKAEINDGKLKCRIGRQCVNTGGKRGYQCGAIYNNACVSASTQGEINQITENCFKNKLSNVSALAPEIRDQVNSIVAKCNCCKSDNNCKVIDACEKFIGTVNIADTSGSKSVAK